MLLLAVVVLWLARCVAHHHAAPAAIETEGQAQGTRPITLDTPVRLHGPVKKHGPLAMLSLLGGGAQRAELLFPPVRGEAWVCEAVRGSRLLGTPHCIASSRLGWTHPRTCTAGMAAAAACRAGTTAAAAVHGALVKGGTAWLILSN